MNSSNLTYQEWRPRSFQDWISLIGRSKFDHGVSNGDIKFQIFLNKYPKRSFILVTFDKKKNNPAILKLINQSCKILLTTFLLASLYLTLVFPLSLFQIQRHCMELMTIGKNAAQSGCNTISWWAHGDFLILMIVTTYASMMQLL